MKRAMIAIALGLSVLLAGAGSVWAQAKAGATDKAEADDKGKDPGVKVERRGGKKIFRITTGFVIEGRIQKPNAFYVLQRSQINYDWAKLKRDFVPRIIDSVNKAPF